MQTNRKHVIVAAGMALLFLPALAQTQTGSPAKATAPQSSTATQAKPATTSKNPVHGSVTAGPGYLSQSSYKFGEWTGLVDKGFYPVLGIDVGQFPAWNSTNPDYWEVNGSNLGLPSRTADAKVGKLGSYSLQVSYQGIPHYQWQNARTPYSLVNGNDLRLPAHFGGLDPSSESTWNQTVNSNLKPNLHGVDLKTQRDISKAIYTVRLSQHWSVIAEVRHDHKDGLIDFGSVMATFGQGGPNSVLVPLPIDYNINQVHLSTAYQKGTLDMSVGYLGSFYHDNLSSYTWDNPYLTPSNNSGYDSGGRGLAATPPNNMFNQMLFSGSWGMPFWTTRMVWDMAYGLERQDATLLPYTINPNIIINEPLPVQNADAEVRTTQANMRFVMNPLERMEFMASFRYDNHADNTPTYAFYPVINDNGTQATTPFYNVPYSYQSRTGKLRLAYNFGSVRPFLAYQYEEKDQSFVEVGTTQSNKVTGGVSLQPGEITQIRLSGTYDRRHGTPYMNSYRYQLEEYGSYNPAGDTNPQNPANFALWSNNPLLRMFWLANRTRRRADLTVNLTPSGPFAVGLDAQYAYDKYSDSTLGLLSNKTQTYTVEAGYYPSKKFGATIYGTYQRLTNEQAGISFPGYNQGAAFDFTNYWQLSGTEPVYEAGMNLDVKELNIGLHNPVDIKFNASYVYSSDQLTMATGSAQTANAGTFPNIIMRMLNFSLSGVYHVTERLGMQVGIGWQRYISTNWHFSNVYPWTVGPSDAVLTAGQQAPDYSVTWVSLAMNYRF